MTDLPTVVTPSGLVPQNPADLRAQLVASVAATNPGFTDALPLSLVEDIVSTDVGAVVLIDQARVETVDSLTPFGCNAFVLGQLGQIYGVPYGVGSNTSVDVVFSGTVGFVVTEGFVIGDGTNLYQLQDSGIIGAGGTTPTLTALAVSQGAFAVPAGTVTQLVTSVPSTITLSVTNPNAGVPGQAAQTETSYRAQVLQAGLAASQGMSRYLKTLLGSVHGVQPRLVSVRQNPGGGWEVIAGGGDAYQVAFAIYSSLFDVSSLVGSTMTILNITQANPGVVQTLLNHGYATGAVVKLNNVNPAGYDGTYTITVIDATHFSIGVNTTGYPAYVSGGYCTPNLRNVVVTINDYPDLYDIPFVVPPQQTVNLVVTWNTSQENFTAQAAVTQLAQPALVTYINSIPVGQPINLGVMEQTFREAVEPVLDTNLLTRLIFAVSINGVGVSPVAGTETILSDPESYFFTQASDVAVNQG